MWMKFRDGIADPELKVAFKPKLLCELFLLHQHPGLISEAEVSAVQTYFRAQNNRRYAYLSTAQKNRRLLERERLLKETAAQQVKLAELEGKLRASEFSNDVSRRRALQFARLADVAEQQVLRGGGFADLVLASVRVLPHCETASSPLEPFDPVSNPSIVIGENASAILNTSDEQVLLDFSFSGTGM